MKILILVDLLNNWALHNRAKAIAKFLPEHSFEIRPALGNHACLNGQEQFDLIHFNFSYGITQYTDFILSNARRCVVTIVNERSYFQDHGVNREGFTAILQSGAALTTVSKRIAECLGIDYIPNGIDQDLFNKFKNPVIGYAGTLGENKNPVAIVEACNELGLLCRMTSYDAGKADLDHSRMADFYNSVDVYVHASLTEGFNNTIIEALSCNVPVLMTKQGCWEEFVGYVTFIDPTKDSIKEALKPFIGRQLIGEKFLWKNIVPKYQKVYQAAYANR